jgi:hypothetical protein
MLKFIGKMPDNEDGSRKAGSRKPEAGSRKPEAGSQKSEARKQEVGSTEARSPESEARKYRLFRPQTSDLRIIKIKT